jgi:phenylacetate-CoA oxygenase PaaJ subunit
MVIAMFDDAGLRRHAWDVAASVVDPEIPVLTIADLGVLREVTVEEGRVEVTITPTYSGCPAMNMITLEIELALEREGFRDARVRTVLAPAWTTDWMSEEGHRKLPPRSVRQGPCGMPAMRIARYRGNFRIRLDRLQGAVALQDMPRAVRLFQVSLENVGTTFPPPCRQRHRICGLPANI